jgi:hypothetical protein
MTSFRFFFAAILAVATFGLTPAAMAQAQQPAKPKAAAPKQPAKPAHPTQSAAVTPAGGAQPALLGQFGDWGAYAASPGGHKVCFALAKPSASRTDPPNRPRDPAYLFVSSRPAEKVKNEVSVIIGYGFKPSSDATVEVSGSSYAMYTQNDGAWIKNAAEEAHLIEAMRKGADLTVKGTSSRGTQTTDTYSLRGLSQALDRIGQECR